MTDEEWKRTPKLQKQALQDYSKLTKQLIGLEGFMVEVKDKPKSYPRRFFVGKSGGQAPVHVELERKNDKEGNQAQPTYHSVKRISRGLPPAPKKVQVTYYRPDMIVYQGKTGRRSNAGEPEL